MKLKEKFKAVKLRERGLSYKEIFKKINVSKSTLSIWLREIELTPEQKNKLNSKIDKVRYEVARRKVADRIKRTNDIISEARENAKTLATEPLFLTGLALYWAEGAKNSTESVKFANSDSNMIMLMMEWLRKMCKVPEKKFRVHIHMHDLHSRKDINAYWSKITDIPLNQFYKPYVKKTSLGQRRNILYNGTCSIIVSDKNLFRKICGWKLGLQDYFNIPS